MTLRTWLYILLAVAVAGAGNSVATLWATSENKTSIWLWAMLLVSPFVFITFGLVAGRTGLAVASATVDALLVVATVVIGLIFFRESSRLSALQGLGIALSVAGIFLMLFFPKSRV